MSLSTLKIYGVRSGTKSILRFRGLRNTSSLQKLFFESLSVVFVASVPCLRFVASLVSSYCFLQVSCCLRGVSSMSSSRRIPRFIVRGVGSMSSSRRIPHFIVLFSSSHCLLSSWRRFHVFESSHPSFHRTVFFGPPLCRRCVIFMSSCRRVVPKSYRLKGQPRNTRNEFPIRADFGNSRKYPIWQLKRGEN